MAGALGTQPVVELASHSVTITGIEALAVPNDRSQKLMPRVRDG